MSTFTVSFQGEIISIDLPLHTTTLADLREYLQEMTNVASSGQKLIYKGKVSSAPPTATLEEAGIRRGVKVMLLGTPAQALSAFKAEEADAERRQAILARRSANPAKVLSQTHAYRRYLVDHS